MSDLFTVSIVLGAVVWGALVLGSLAFRVDRDEPTAIALTTFGMVIALVSLAAMAIGFVGTIAFHLAWVP